MRGASDRGGSSGLGLSIVRAVAETHGGSVTLDPTALGARFVVRLPGQVAYTGLCQSPDRFQDSDGQVGALPL